MTCTERLLYIKKLAVLKAVFIFLAGLMVSCDNDDNDLVFNSIRGNFKCQENSNHSQFRSYLVEIDRVIGQENLYIITNFHSSGNISFIYTSLVNDTLYIENQMISNSFVTGRGIVSPNFREIELVYYLDDGRTEYEYFARYFR